MRSLCATEVALPDAPSFLHPAADQLEPMPLSQISSLDRRGFLDIEQVSTPPFRSCKSTVLGGRWISLALLGQLPTNSLIVSPSERVLLKCPDGRWCNWTTSGMTNAYLQAGHTVPAGSTAYLPNNQHPCYRKHPNGTWLAASSSGSSAQNHAPVQSSSQPAAGPATAPLQPLPQIPYRRGAIPVDECLVIFNVPMTAAESGRVPDLEVPAYSGGELATQEKATIRFNLQDEASVAEYYRARQYNLQRYGRPIMRGQLAQSIAEELRRLLDALEEAGRPLRSSSGRRVAFEDVILVDVRRVSRGSLQPMLAVRGA